MKRRLLLCVLLTGLLATPAAAVEFAGVQLADSIELAGQPLQLNGYGLRTKFFFKVYAGALYTPQPATRPAPVYQPEWAKAIRMHFIHSKVAAHKIRDAFRDGFDNNNPGFADTPEARAFLALFKVDLREGDLLQLSWLPAQRLEVHHNGRQLGRFDSAPLAKAVLDIYLGPQPIQSLKEGMLRGGR